MSRVKGPHHRGTHQVRAKRITTAAYANPLHKCWRCARTLSQVKAAHPDRRVIWTAGHLPGWDSQPNAPMAAECSPCNYSAGATAGNRARAQRTQPSRRTDLTW